MNKMNRRISIEQLRSSPINYLFWFVMLITFMVVFVPFIPNMPTGGLDPSWKFGVNQAIAQGLSIGKDIIFTYGPYASIWTRTYHPATDSMMLIGSMYLVFVYWICVVFLMKGIQRRWILIYCCIFFPVVGIYWRQSLIESLPFIVGLVIYKALSSEKEDLVKSKLAPFYVSFLFSSFGLLSLIKGNYLILCGAVTILCSVLFVINRQRILAVICLCSPVVSLFYLWILSGQSAADLPTYIITLLPMISGYTDAMSGSNVILADVILYLMTTLSVLLVIVAQKKITGSSKVFLFLLYFVYLFFSFKGGLIRDTRDSASGSILTAVLLLPFIFYNSRLIFPIILLTFISWGSYSGNHYRWLLPQSIFNHLRITYASAWSGVKDRLGNKDENQRLYELFVDEINEEVSLPVFSGTADIYSYEQSYLIASGSLWSPRPIFQSYSAYTPKLAEINKNYLMGDQAPDNIIFEVTPIDGRLPSIEDGLSWPLLLAKYQLTGMENGFLYLQKTSAIRIIEELKHSKERHVFEEPVTLPQSNKLIFAQFEIKHTILGRLVSMLYKPSRLLITVEEINGLKKYYRLIPGMATGILISPLIENTTEFGMLFSHEVSLDYKSVKSISITDDGPSMIRLWSNEYSVSFSEIENPSSSRVQLDEDNVQPDILESFKKFRSNSIEYKINKIHHIFNRSIGKTRNNDTATQCQGYIDGFDYFAGDNDEQYVDIHGWIFQPDTRAAPSSIDILNEDRQIVGYATSGESRPDVGRAIDPKASESGFRGFLLKQQLEQPIILRGYEPDCEMTVNVPRSQKR